MVSTPSNADRAWALLCARLQRDPATSQESDTCTLRAAWKAMLAFAATPSNAGSPNVGEGVVPAGMKAWHGGAKPDDWSGEAVQFRSGEVIFAPPAGTIWKLGWDHSYGNGDIIAYTPRATSPTVPAIPVDRERWRHVKRGTTYEVIGVAELQAEQLQAEHAALTIYRGEDGKLWARNSAEFQDGRFVRLAASPAYTPRPVEGEVDVSMANRPGHCSECGGKGRHAQDCSHLCALARPAEARAGKLAEVARLREALEPFAKLARDFDAASLSYLGVGIHGLLAETRLPVGGMAVRDACTISLGELIAADAALTTPAGGIAEGGRTALQRIVDSANINWPDGAAEQLSHVIGIARRALAATAPDREKGAEAPKGD